MNVLDSGLEVEIKSALRDLGEMYWFRGESEAGKGNKARQEVFIARYHNVHDLIARIEGRVCIVDKCGKAQRKMIDDMPYCEEHNH